MRWDYICAAINLNTLSICLTVPFAVITTATADTDAVFVVFVIFVFLLSICQFHANFKSRINKHKHFVFRNWVYCNFSIHTNTYTTTQYCFFPCFFFHLSVRRSVNVVVILVVAVAAAVVVVAAAVIVVAFMELMTLDLFFNFSNGISFAMNFLFLPLPLTFSLSLSPSFTHSLSISISLPLIFCMEFSLSLVFSFRYIH